jgi:hypothetical protein
VLTFKSGPVNSVRGAAFLVGVCAVPSRCVPVARCGRAVPWLTSMPGLSCVGLACKQLSF